MSESLIQLIQSYNMCVSSILDVPPVHDVLEIPGLDDFTVYLIMAGSFAAVDQIVCCIVCLLIRHFSQFISGFHFGFSHLFTLVLCKILLQNVGSTRNK